MSHPKQQALMFLLGAVLVGGVLGFSADRVLARPESEHTWAGRKAMYDDLELTAQQRATMDSLLDARTCQIRAVLRPVRPQVDSIRAAGQSQIRRVLTARQWSVFETRQREDSLRREEAKRVVGSCE